MGKLKNWGKALVVSGGLMLGGHGLEASAQTKLAPQSDLITATKKRELLNNFDSIYISIITTSEFNKFKNGKGIDIIEYYGDINAGTVKNNKNGIDSIDLHAIANILKTIYEKPDGYYRGLRSIPIGNYRCGREFSNPDIKAITGLVRSMMGNNYEDWQINLISKGIFAKIKPIKIKGFEDEDPGVDYGGCFKSSIEIRNDIRNKWNSFEIGSQIVEGKRKKVSLEIIDKIKKKPNKYGYFLPDGDFVINNDKILQDLVSKKIKREFREYFEDETDAERLIRLITNIVTLIVGTCLGLYIHRTIYK